MVLDQARRALAELGSQPNVARLSPGQIRMQAEPFGTRTVYGSVNFVSTVKNRCAALTVTLGTGAAADAPTQKRREIAKGARETLRSVHEYLQKAPLVATHFTIGHDPRFALTCRLYTSVYRPEMIRLAYKALQSFFPAQEGPPDLTVILIPEWQERDRQILVLPEAGLTYILGTDFYGELRHAFLRMAIWRAKQEGMLGLHASAQMIRARDAGDHLRRIGVIMFGIASTGKTTHACDNHGLDLLGEDVRMVQDEVIFWRPDGAALGSERGFYVKTEGLTPQTQPVLYQAATSEQAVLDNVVVDHEGRIHFDDRTLTANSRAVVQSNDLGQLASDLADLPAISEIDRLVVAFLSRSQTVVPVASKLTAEQAAVAFVLGESIDVSGADARIPLGPGRDVMTNPFLVGDPAEEANRFYEFLTSHGQKVECYLLNTGGVGELVEHGLDGTRFVHHKATRIARDEMATIIRGILRGTIRWREDSNWMVHTPEFVDGLEIARFDLDRHYDQEHIDSLIAAIRLERGDYIDQIYGLDAAIRKSVEF